MVVRGRVFVLLALLIIFLNYTCECLTISKRLIFVSNLKSSLGKLKVLEKNGLGKLFQNIKESLTSFISLTDVFLAFCCLFFYCFAEMWVTPGPSYIFSFEQRQVELEQDIKDEDQGIFSRSIWQYL